MNKSSDYILKKAVDDLQKLTHEGVIYAGLPHFNCLFGRDSIIVSLQLIDYNIGYAKNTLKKLASLQGNGFCEASEEEPGKILHEHRLCDFPHPKWKFPYYGSADSTPLYLVLVAKYYEKTKDLGLIKKLWPNIINAFEWIKKHGDVDGDFLVEYKRKFEHGLQNQGWKDSGDSISYPNGDLVVPPVSLIEIQGYVYMALSSLYYIASDLGKHCQAAIFKAHADLLLNKIDDFWMDDEQYYSIGLDSNKKQIKIIGSNPGHLLFCEAINPKRAELVVKRLMEPDMYSGWGIRTLSSKEKRYDPFSYHNGSIWFHDNWVICEGMKKYGFKNEAAKVQKNLIQAAVELKEIPELFSGVSKNGDPPLLYKNACHTQAWAAGTILCWLDRRRVVRDH